MAIYDYGARRKSLQTGWLKYNRYAERGFGILVSDIDGKEVFAHVRGFYGYPKAINDAEVRALEYRRRFRFRLTFDAKSDRICAADVIPLPELMGPDGEIIALPDHDEAMAEAETAEAERTKPEQQPARSGFGALVAALQ